MLIFVALLPQLTLPLMMPPGRSENGGLIDANFSRILLYSVYLLWALGASWICLAFLDRLKLSSLGLTWNRNRWREVTLGTLIGVLMVAAVAGLQYLGGGTQVRPNPIWWQAGAVNGTGIAIVAGEISAALLLLVLAAAFEELVYRGYPFQTLLRGAPAIVPILLLGALFGASHLRNPNRTLFSTINTVLAGVWLSLAYLKTRSLWFPTSLHFSWNWMMGACFGLPVSGLSIPRHPIFLSTSEDPVWLTGGSYGCEGGAAATAVLIAAAVWIWRAKWLKDSTEPQTIPEGRFEIGPAD
ncbi:MAG TPA: type II CAAX endopeptidase family protein [Blastocatellia bacterium]|nr:type II CAAX endopeptidase family protein [Blastocatellia bacterium]